MDEQFLIQLADVIEVYLLLGEKTNSGSLIKTSSDLKNHDGCMDEHILTRLKLLDFIDSILSDAGYSKE